MAAWHFAYVPKKESEIIREKHRRVARGWGSIPVTAQIGKTAWKTSIFPDKKSGQYLLPLKLEIRKKEEIGDGDTIKLSLSFV